MTDSQPDTIASPGGVQALDPQELGAYFVLMEAVSLLQHQVEQQLRGEGGISDVQFQLLCRRAGSNASCGTYSSMPQMPANLASTNMIVHNGFVHALPHEGMAKGTTR
jgi:hypothetical protein